jgi:hypothetical protein
MHRRSLFALAPFTAGVVLIACNSITGVNDLGIGNPQGMGGTGNGSNNGGSSSTMGQGAGMPMPTPMVAAQGVNITEIAVYQAVKRSIFGGQPPSSGVKVPIVAGRPALIRVFTAVDGGYDGSPVTARLFLGSDPQGDVVGTPVASSDQDLSSTLNFEVPPEKMVTGLQYRVELLQPLGVHSKGDNMGAFHPASGTEAMDVQSDGMSLKLSIVPIRYGGDGSNRVPDTSDAQIQGYKDYFFGTYPIRQLDISVHAPWSWSGYIGPDGSGWGEVLDGLAQMRIQEGTPADVYYFGAFEPAPSFDQFCQSGCVAGLGLIGSPGDTYSRAAVGLGYSGDMAWTTAIHEIGHTQGRQHSPCGGASGVDPQYPWPNANIGVWGYDLVSKQLIGPNQGKDMMGYCDPYWISDFTYKAIFDRIKTVNKALIEVPDALKNLVWERARVDGQGKLSWLPPQQLELPPQGEATKVTVIVAGAATVADGHFFPYDHLPGGVLFWPKQKASAARVEVTLGGKSAVLVR